MKNHTTTRCHAIIVAIAILALAGVLAPASFASGPKFQLNMDPPTYVSAGETLTLAIAVQNVGDQPTSGPIVVVDRPGAALGPVSYRYYSSASSDGYVSSAVEATCENSGMELTCEYGGVLNPGVQLTILVEVPISEEAAGTLTNKVAVSGGGTAGEVTEEEHFSTGAHGPFDFSLAAVSLLNADGSEAVAAGSDPAEYTTSLRWPSFSSYVLGTLPQQTGLGHFKNVVAHLPPGMIGNPSAPPAVCKTDELDEEGALPWMNRCPVDSQVGVAHVYLDAGFTISDEIGLFNMEAPYGVATELGFQIARTVVLLKAYVRPGDHGIDVVSEDTSTTLPITRVEITAWGNSSDHSHDPYRSGCLSNGGGAIGLSCPTGAVPKAFLRMPTSCSGKPLQFGAEFNSYEEPDNWKGGSFTGPTLKGCDLVPFSPQITVDPTATAASSPTGVSVKLSLPQSQNPEGLQEADLKKAVVTLPEGMAINPSAADGLQACDDAHLHLDSNTPAECPDGSKVGTVLLHTQLIPNPIEGNVYLRTQNSSDPMSGEMFRMAIELRDDSHGLDFKIPGQIQANPVTGRLTTTFDDNPQFPFEDISLQFKAGARAPLATPASCQTQTTEADLYSWAQPDTTVHRSDSFTLTSGPEGKPCAATQPFEPGFEAGVKSVQAGGFTPFLATFSRKDADQSMQRVSVKMPKGLLGSLVGLPLCGEAQANTGTCDQASEIGSVTAGAGAGPTPFYVTGGHVYMTGPYKGAPFGLSVAVPAKAGPFDLGTVVVRAKVEVDIHTAQLTVTTDPLPQVVGGVPVNLRLVNVTINRPNFTYNPTSCDPTSVSGTMTGGQGAVAHLGNDFHVTNCAALRFKPQFKVSTSGKTSRASGASLNAKLVYPKTAQGTQANIARVKVALPKQLPSRLTTLQKACTAATFDTNPAACPGPSRIGTATATTPVLPVPLTGPVYFVSHGGEAFPDLVVVLQGYGVTVDLIGTTFISKAGITSTTFKQIPDVPVGTFELKLPQGKYSALAANGDLCKTKLTMPTSFVAQDGAQLQKATSIVVTGCAKHKSKKLSKQSRKSKHNKKR